jgi:hypothetical protein
LKQFDQIFNLLERASGAVPPENRYLGNLTLVAHEHTLRFTQDANTKGPARFIAMLEEVSSRTGIRVME